MARRDNGEAVLSASSGSSAKGERKLSDGCALRWPHSNSGVAYPPDSGLVGLDVSDIDSILSKIDEFLRSNSERGEFGSDDIVDEPVVAD